MAASNQTPFDPFRPHIQRLRTWWTELLERALGQPAQLTGAMALSVFGGSFDGDSATAVLAAVPGSNVARLLRTLPVLSVLQDAGAWTGETGFRLFSCQGSDHPNQPCHALPCRATP